MWSTSDVDVDHLSMYMIHMFNMLFTYDVHVMKSPCNNLQFSADNKKVKNKKSKEIEGYMCTFEEGMCDDWQPAKGVMRENRKRYKDVAQGVAQDIFVDFQILRGSSPSFFTGL